MGLDQPQGGRPRCTAKSKTTGEQCRQYAITGSTKCHYHGGKTPSGVASPHFKTGRYSKVLPERLRERYEAAVADPELLALREDIALVDARLDDLLKRVDAGESDALWKAVRSTWTAHKKARARDDGIALSETFDELDELIGVGIGDLAAWAEVRQALDQRRRLVESERKRLVDMQQMLTAEQAMVFVSMLTDAVRRHVTDRETLAAISREIVAATGPHPTATDLADSISGAGAAALVERELERIAAEQGMTVDEARQLYNEFVDAKRKGA